MRPGTEDGLTKICLPERTRLVTQMPGQLYDSAARNKSFRGAHLIVRSYDLSLQDLRFVVQTVQGDYASRSYCYPVAALCHSMGCFVGCALVHGGVRMTRLNSRLPSCRTFGAYHSVPLASTRIGFSYVKGRLRVGIPRYWYGD